jgi:hypothetical protein
MIFSQLNELIEAKSEFTNGKLVIDNVLDFLGDGFIDYLDLIVVHYLRKRLINDFNLLIDNLDVRT